MISVGLLIATAPGVGQELPRPGLDTPRLRIAVADFRAIGGDELAAREISDDLRRALSTHAQLEVIGGEDALMVLAEAEEGIMGFAEGAARTLADRLGVDAVVYGKVVTDVGALLADPVAAGAPFAQLIVAETLTLEGQLFPSAPIALVQEEGQGLAAELSAVAVGLLPAVGRVLSIIETPHAAEIQLFPLGGRVLASDADYGVYDPVAFRVLRRDAEGRSEALARQDLRLGRLTGRVRTAKTPDDHAVSATSADPAGRVSVGQLVGLPPTGDAPPRSPDLPVLLVNAIPTDAVVLIGDRVAGVTPVAVPLEAGAKTTVTIVRRDFHQAGIDVTPGARDGFALAVTLQEIPPIGALRLATDPAGAEVKLDGEVVGKTPLTVDHLSAGEHALAVALDGFRPIAQALDIRRGRTTDLRIDLQEDARRVLIASEPEGARVTLDAKAVGTTPLTIDALRTGRHEIRLTLANHATEKRAIRVNAEGPEQSFRFRLRALAGNLRIESDPPGATVTVDGRDVGRTPLALTAVAIGQHQIGVTLDGCLPITRTLNVQDQQTATLQEKLVRAEGGIQCVSVPAGAAITLDGEAAGVTPTTLENVPIGTRALQLTLKGYRPWTARVPVLHGETTRVEVALIRETQAGP